MTVVFLLTGLTGSGKTQAAQELSTQLGLPIFSVSDFIKAEATTRGFRRVDEFTKAYNKTLVSYQETFPQLFQQIKKVQTQKGIIIDGLYDPKLYAELRTLFRGHQIHLVNIRGTRHTRKRRIMLRNQLDAKTAKKYLRSVGKTKFGLGLNDLLAQSQSEGIAIKPIVKNQSFGLVQQALRKRRKPK